MNTEPQLQQAGKERQNWALLFLMAEGIRQDSKRLCKEAAVAQKTAQDILHISWLARQGRRDTSGMRLSTIEMTHSFTRI
jgi:hypothetical protein